MLISYNWLKNYIPLTQTPEEISATLTSVGLEVEHIEYLGKQFDNIVVGKILSVQKHPNADKLSLCSVLVQENETPLQIICGAPNVAENQTVAVALAGAIVPKTKNEEKPFVISKAKIRGIESNGMICSETELAIGNDASGIMVLENSAKVGTPLAEYLGMNDVVFEIAITPNRPDCLSHIGIARELAAQYSLSFTLPQTEPLPNISEKKLSVQIIDEQKCPRYAACVINNITVKQSPQWLQNFLTVVGLRPINNIVDITNFVMLEFGQPLHAFDSKEIQGNSIIVKTASVGEKFFTLDGKEHSLPESTLMICDKNRSIAIAGVMGGKNSAITESATSVILESAYFSPNSIRKTAKTLGISTDASYRFERGVDPNITMKALQRAANLIVEIAGGKIQEYTDLYPKPIQEKNIEVRIAKVNSILGTTLSLSQIQHYLTSIEIKVQKISEEKIICTIPTFRPDITEEIDIVEEVARLHGYHNIEDAMKSEINLSSIIIPKDETKEIRNFLEDNGVYEILTNSLLDEKTAQMFSEHSVKILNPMSVEQSMLRPTLVPGMLRTLYHNQNHGNENLCFYEIGNIFLKNEKKFTFIKGYEEYSFLGLCMSGRKEPIGWSSHNRTVDIFDMKGMVEGLAQKIGLDKIQFISYDETNTLTEQTLHIQIYNTYIGYLGKIKKEILDYFSLKNDVYVAEINLDTLKNIERKEKKYTPSSKFPTVVRDVAFIVDAKLSVEKIQKTIKNSAGNLLTELTVFDIFSGGNLSQEKKSVAFSLHFSSIEKTLTDNEIEKIMEKIIAHVSREHNAVLRN